MPDESDSVSGSKSSSQEHNIDFRFLNFTNPSDAKNAQTRKSVRSHVTTGQHKAARKAAAEHALRSHQTSARPSPSRSPTSGRSENDASSPEATSPTTPPALARLGPRELYPEGWQSSISPVMVRCLLLCHTLYSTDSFPGLLRQLDGYRSARDRQCVEGVHTDTLPGPRVLGSCLLACSGAGCGCSPGEASW